MLGLQSAWMGAQIFFRPILGVYHMITIKLSNYLSTVGVTLGMVIFFFLFHNFFSALSIDQVYTLIKSQKKLGTYLLQKWTTKGMQVRAN